MIKMFNIFEVSFVELDFAEDFHNFRQFSTDTDFCLVDAGGMVGGGVGEKKEKTLRGNATGLHMNTPQTNR